VPEAAAKRDLSPANDSQYDNSTEGRSTPVIKHAINPGINPGINPAINDNPVRRTIEEFRCLIDEMDDIREFLRAHGVPLRTTRMMVEFGVQKKPQQQASAIDSAMEQSEQAMGEGCLARSDLENHVATIVNLERDLSHARSVARSEGLDSQALGILTKMIQENPGDGGTKAVNTFLSYVVATGIQTDQIKDLVGELTQKSASVLPQIPRKVDTIERYGRQQFVTDIIVGLVIGVLVIGLLI